MNSDVPWRADISTKTVKFEHGAMNLPDKPGLGIEIKVEEIKKHPFVAKEPRHSKGTLTDIRPADAKKYFAKI